MYAEFHASECHKGPRYEEPACMADKQALYARVFKFARATAPKSTTPRPDYPAYLLRAFNGVLCETL